MIECDLDSHKDIFYSRKEFAKHIIKEHKSEKDFMDWAERYLKSYKQRSQK